MDPSWERKHGNTKVIEPLVSWTSDLIAFHRIVSDAFFSEFEKPGMRDPLMEEILHQLMENLPLFTGFYTSQVVVWDF